MYRRQAERSAPVLQPADQPIPKAPLFGSLQVLVQSPGLASKGEFDSRTKRERQGRKAERLNIMFTQQVLNVCVGRQPGRDLITSAKIEPLIRPVQIAVRQQHRLLKICVQREKVTIVTSTDQCTCKRTIELRLRVVQPKVPRM